MLCLLLREAESETVIYSNSALQGSSLQHICKYKIAGKLWNARHSWNQFYNYQLAAEHMCVSAFYCCSLFVFILLYALHRDSARLASAGTGVESI